MGKKYVIRVGLAILVLGIMGLGYGGSCKKEDDTISGSSSVLNAPSDLTLL